MAVGDQIQVPEGCRLNPVTDKDAEVPYDLWDPHYTDGRFLDARDGLTIFVDPDQVLVEGRWVDEQGEGLEYMYSDRLYQFYGDAVTKAAKKAEREVNVTRSARFVERMLQGVFEDESLWLGHMRAGVNRDNGYSYKIYGYKTEASQNG